MSTVDGHDGVEQQERLQDADAGARAARGYSPHEHRPVGVYALLAGVFLGGTGGTLLALQRRGRPLPERVGAADVLMIGIATHKLSRLLTKDKATSFLRAPFTRFQRSSGHGEVEEEPRGEGLQLAIGELLVCPYCLAQWVAGGLSVGLVGAPRLTRLVSGCYVALTVSDFLQLAYHAAEEHG